VSQFQKSEVLVWCCGNIINVVPDQGEAGCAVLSWLGFGEGCEEELQGGAASANEIDNNCYM
jgi:hypothetical protein